MSSQPLLRATRILPAGIHDSVPMRDYISDPCEAPSVSTGVIEAITYRSPLHARADHPRFRDATVDDDGSVPADTGSAIHQLAIGGDQRIEWIDAADYRTKAAKEARDAARAVGKIPMLVEHRQRIEAAATAARARLLAEFPTGRAEQTLIWQEHGAWCRARPDWLPEADYVVDLKTTKNADPMSWIRSTLSGAGYDSQAAHVLAGICELRREQRDFVFLLVEVDPPHATSLVGLGPAYRELASAKREKALRVWAECLRTNTWPAYREEIHWAEPAGWQQFELEMRQAS